jgi:hypothetical protein
MLHASSVASAPNIVRTSYTPTLKDRPYLLTAIRVAKVAYITITLKLLYHLLPVSFDSTRSFQDRIYAGFFISLTLLPICLPTLIKIDNTVEEIMKPRDSNALFGLDEDTMVAIENDLSILKTQIVIVKNNT